MIGVGVSSVYEGSGMIDEGVVIGSGNDEEGFIMFDSGRSVVGVVFVFVDGERFIGDGRLINLEESIIGDDVIIGGNNGIFFNL